MTYTTEIRFSSRVLGKNATMNLKAHKVYQTIRSHFSLPVDQDKVLSDPLPIYLDDQLIGHAQVYHIKLISLADLHYNDVIAGGFRNYDELISALKRAGYRFKKIEDYKAYIVRFIWTEKKEEKS